MASFAGNSTILNEGVAVRFAAPKRKPVVKIGSSTLTRADGSADIDYLRALASQIARVRQVGWGAVIVTSGAIAVGLNKLGIDKRPTDMPSLQAAASVGQGELAAAYAQAFAEFDLVTSLVLLTRRDTADRTAYLHARDTLNRLLELGIVPIVNENDTVSVEQIKFGDNDTLAALVACLANADRVVILSDIDGLYTSNPKTDPSAQLIKRVDRITPEILAGASGAGSAVGSGGMITKLTSARVLGAAGIPLVICSGRAEDAVVRSLADDPIGTLFTGADVPHEITPRKLWIALGDSVKGTLLVDAGAARAIVEDGASLLAVGVKNVEGEFEAEDVVDVVDEAGFVIARGLARCSAESMRSGKADVAVHRDELILFE